MTKLLVGVGLGLASAALSLALGLLPFVGTIELKTYDWRMRATADPSVARDDIVLVAIDEQSIRGLEPLVGRWPWPRLVHAQLLNFLARARPRAVIYDVLFTEHDRRRFTVQDEEWSGEESDEALAAATRRLGNVVHTGDAETDTAGADVPPVALPGSAAQAGGEPRPVFTPPFPDLLEASRAVGHNLVVLDADGPIRRYVPFVQVGGVTIPALAVAGAIQILDIDPGQVRSTPGALWLGERRLPLVTTVVASWEGESRAADRLMVSYPGVWPDGRQTYRTYSFYELFYAEQQLLVGETPAIRPSAFDDRIVVVGATAAGLEDVFTTPLPGEMPGAEVHAAVVDSILSGRWITPAPAWMAALTVAAAGTAGGLLLVMAGPWVGLAGAMAGAAAIVAAATWRFAHGLWLPLVTPLLALTVATFGGVAWQYFVEGREKRRVKHLFSRYVSPDVYGELLRDPDGARLGGHRRHMTVLFSDIRGFTTLSERGRPEEVVGQLNEYFSRMVPIVFAHRGTVDKFVGDMIMALFGAPLDDAEHADHAVQTALAMTAELATLNREWAAQGRSPLDIGIGINTGDMVAGNLGSDAIMSYTVIGDNVNLGARLESLNKDFRSRVIISEFTRVSLKGRYDIRSLGDVVVKGKSVPVSIHEVVLPDAISRDLGEDARESGQAAGAGSQAIQEQG